MRLLTMRLYSRRYGAENHMLRIACAAASNGIEVHAAFPSTPATSSMIDECTAAGVIHVPFEYNTETEGITAPRSKSTLRPNVLQIQSLLQTIRPDVVQFTAGWPPEVTAPSIACAFCNVPLLAVFQFAQTLHLPKKKLELLAWARQKRQRWMAVSQQNLSCLQATFHTNEIGLLLNGVEIMERPSSLEIEIARREVRNELGLPISSSVLLTTARIEPRKGYADLLSVVPDVVSRFPDVVFVWAGDGESRTLLEAECVRQGLQGRVLFLGYRTDVVRLLRASDLFVFPSHGEGGCSSSIREAMVNCIPIVCSDAGGIPEMISDNTHGLVFPAGNRDAMLAQICNALTNPAKMRDMADQARQRIEGFSFDRMLKNYLKEFNELAVISAPAELTGKHL